MPSIVLTSKWPFVLNNLQSLSIYEINHKSLFLIVTVFICDHCLAAFTKFKILHSGLPIHGGYCQLNIYNNTKR